MADSFLCVYVDVDVVVWIRLWLFEGWRLRRVSLEISLIINRQLPVLGVLAL